MKWKHGAVADLDEGPNVVRSLYQGEQRPEQGFMQSYDPSRKC